MTGKFKVGDQVVNICPCNLCVQKISNQIGVILQADKYGYVIQFEKNEYPVSRDEKDLKIANSFLIKSRLGVK